MKIYLLAFELVDIYKLNMLFIFIFMYLMFLVAIKMWSFAEIS